MDDALKRWGVEIFHPIASTVLTESVTLRHSMGPATDAAPVCVDEVQMPLSLDLLPKPMALRSNPLADVPAAATEHVARFMAKRRAESTMRAYASTFKKILRTCVQLDVRPYPMSPGGLVGVIATMAGEGASYATLRSVRNTTKMMHDFEGLPDPTQSRQFKQIWIGIRREVGVRNPHRKIALTRAEVGEIISIALKCRRRDLATMFALQFESALRVEELMNLRCDSVIRRRNQTTLLVSLSKTDQYGKGELVHLACRAGAPFNVMELLDEWLERRDSDSEYLFPAIHRNYKDDSRESPEKRQRRAYSRALKAYAAAIGLDAAEVGTHSLRAGYATEEIDLGLMSIAQIAAHLRHASIDTLLIYYRPRGVRRDFVAETSAVLYQPR